MLYLKRKIDAFLSEWKENPDKKPLIVKRAAAGRQDRIHSALCRRELHERYHDQLRGRAKVQNDHADGYKAADIIKNISRIDPSKRFIEGETLISSMNCRSFPTLRPRSNSSRLTAGSTSFAAVPCSALTTARLRATVSATRPITRCSRWI